MDRSLMTEKSPCESISNFKLPTEISALYKDLCLRISNSHLPQAISKNSFDNGKLIRKLKKIKCVFIFSFQGLKYSFLLKSSEKIPSGLSS